MVVQNELSDLWNSRQLVNVTLSLSGLKIAHSHTWCHLFIWDKCNCDLFSMYMLSITVAACRKKDRHGCLKRLLQKSHEGHNFFHSKWSYSEDVRVIRTARSIFTSSGQIWDWYPFKTIAFLQRLKNFYYNRHAVDII